LARIHRDSVAGLFAGPYGLDDALGLDPEPPHAAIAAAAITAAGTIAAARREWRG
jgi:hypothetical protein